MSGAMFFCRWWKCSGTKLVPHGLCHCPALVNRPSGCTCPDGAQ